MIGKLEARRREYRTGIAVYQFIFYSYNQITLDPRPPSDVKPHSSSRNFCYLLNPEPYNRVRRRPATGPYHIRAQINPIQIYTLFFTRINSVKLVVIKTVLFIDMTASRLCYRYQRQGVASLLPPSSGYPNLHTPYT